MTLEKACKIILFNKPFFGLFLLGMNKEYSTRIPTAAVSKKGIGVELLVNEEFWNGLSDKFQEGVLMHEVYHLCFNHLLMWDLYANKSILGLAADLEVNSYIDRDVLPEDCIFNEDYGLPPMLGLKKYYEILNIINNMPNTSDGDGESGKNGDQKDDQDNGNGESSSNQNDKQNNGNGESSSDQSNNQNNEDGQSAQNIVDGLSSKNKQDLKDLINNQDFTHKEWKDFDDLSDAEKELVKNQINHIAKQAAEQIQKTRGSIPAGLTEFIDSLFKIKPAIFNWKAYFRRLLGTVIDVELKKTRKKESNRFEDASGLRHKRKSNIFLVIDTSGSVSDSDLCDFFSEINHIYKAGTNVTICECDAEVQRIYEYTGKWDGTCSGRGGTIMTPAIKEFNKRRRDYQTVIFFTDGYIESNPEKIMGKAVWIITSDGDQARKFPGKTIFIPKNNN